MECVTPHLPEVPENHWYCGTCVDCDTCKTKEAASSGVEVKEKEKTRMLSNELIGVDQSTAAPDSISLWGPSLHQCYACAAVQLAVTKVQSRGNNVRLKSDSPYLLSVIGV